jgi:hypothetical protein
MATTKVESVTMQTFIEREGVVYTVCTGDPNLGDFGDSREVWRKEISFGFTDAYRPGGQAFRDAAAEQERVAYSFLTIGA